MSLFDPSMLYGVHGVIDLFPLKEEGKHLRRERHVCNLT